MHRIVVALAAGHAAHTINERHGLTLLVWPAGTIKIFIQVKKFRAVTSFLLQLVIHFVAVSQAIHQLGVHRFLPQKGTTVNKCHELLRRNLPRLANAISYLVKPGVHQRRHGLLVCRGVLGFGEQVESVLIFVAMVAMKLHA